VQVNPHTGAGNTPMLTGLTTKFIWPRFSSSCHSTGCSRSEVDRS